MSRYIDIGNISELLDQKYREMISTEYGQTYDFVIADTLCEAENLINKIPMADVNPVVHGEWIEYANAHYFKCSICRCIVPYKKAVRIYSNELPEYIFCPHCGADMRGDTVK